MNEETPFLLYATGRYAAGEVVVTWRDEPRPSTPEIDAIIEEAWPEWLARCERNGTICFNGQLLRYLRHRADNGQLTIEVGPTDFAAFIATNYLNHMRINEFGLENCSNPVGSSVLLITADEQLVMGRRSHRVACHAGCVHAVGGGLEAGEVRENGQLDVFESIKREMREELRIDDEQIEEIVSLGLVTDRVVYQPELVFEARISCTVNDLKGRLRPGAADEEHACLVTCADRPDAVLPFIRETPRVVPITACTLCEHGRHAYGEQWYRETLDALCVDTDWVITPLI
jgi:8-oxo-dGTP pyrophosphatase MutT (NUDIX family)